MNVSAIRSDFPILNHPVHGQTLVHFDNAATSQKPESVLRAIKKFYQEKNANTYRGVHVLSKEATAIYNQAREKAREFINARQTREIIFVRNTTEGINLVAKTWGEQNICSGDTVLTTEMEHHSNIIPWMVLLNSKLKTQNLKLEDKGLEIEGKKRRGRLEGEWVLSETEKNNLQFVRVTENGLLDLKDLKNKLKPSNLSKLLVLTHVSNVLGTINPVREIIKKARAVNPKIKVLVDAAQSVPHLKVDVQSLDCDFLVFSGHKMLGPMGIGVLYVKEKVLTGMQPFLTGGDMVQEVHFGNVVWNSLPFKFEAGTANVGGAVGLAAAIDYLRSVGVDKIHQHEQELVRYFLEKLCQAGFRWSNPNSLSSPRPLVLRNGAGNQSRTAKIDILGPMDPLKRAGLVAFRIPGITAHDLAAFLDTQGVAVRSGFHCAQPLHEKFGFNKGSVRVSFYLYNTTKEVDKLVAALQKAVQILS